MFWGINYYYYWLIFMCISMINIIENQVWRFIGEISLKVWKHSYLIWGMKPKFTMNRAVAKSQIQCVPLECLPAVAACRSVSFSKYVKSLSKLLFLCCFLFFLIFPPTPALLTEYVFQFVPPVKIQFQNIIRDCFFWLKAAKKSALRNALKKV